MKNQTKKMAKMLLSSLLAVALLFCLLPGTSVFAEEYVTIGCNDQSPINRSTVTVPAGQTVTVEASGAARYIMTIKADNISVTYRDMEYVSANGQVVVFISSGGQYTSFEITNYADQQQELTLVFSRFQSHKDYPVDLDRIDDMTIMQYSDYEYGQDTGAYLRWTAPSNGTLVLDASNVESEFDGMEGLIVINETVESENGVLTKAVAAGEQLKIRVVALNQFNLPLDAVIHLKVDFDGQQPDGEALEVITPIPTNLTEGKPVSESEPSTQPSTEPTTEPSTETTVPSTQEHVCYVAKYTDVVLSKWYHEALDFMVSNEYMNGMSATTMDPNGNLTRAQWAKLLYEVAGTPSVAGMREPFVDIEEGKWYSNAIIWAYNQGIVKGVSETEFGPNSQITREQMATMLYRYANSPAVTGGLYAYTDGNQVGAYAVDAMVWATQNEIINGVGNNKLDPKGEATRAQAAKILYEYLN